MDGAPYSDYSHHFNHSDQSRNHLTVTGCKVNKDDKIVVAYLCHSMHLDFLSLSLILLRSLLLSYIYIYIQAI